VSSLSVAYILMHFPYLTETFIAEEIQALRAQGIDVHIISLLQPGPGPVQPLSRQLLPHTWYAPPPFSRALWRAQWRFFRRAPRQYLGLLIDLLRQPYPRQALLLLGKRLVTFGKAVAVASYLLDSHAQVLHAHFAWLPGAAASIAASLLQRPFSVTVHAYDLYSWKNELLRLVSSQAAHVVAISDYNRQHVAALGTCAPEAISVVHCGVDLAQFQAPLRSPVAAAAPLRILSVGSLVPKKGHIHLIAACHLLQQRGVDFNCTIIGGGPNQQALDQRIREYGLQERVRLLGALPLPNIVAAYAEHDLFVLASVHSADGDRDGIPVVLMEAGAMDLPLVSTQVSGIPELVRHGETGLLAPPGDPVALADAIAALAANPPLRTRLGQNARALVEAEFNVERNAAHLAALLHSVIQAHQSKSEGTTR